MAQIGRGNPNYAVRLPSGDGAAFALSWGASTHTGRVRTANEDSYLAQTPIFAVADGMGGHAAGDFASAAVVTRLADLTANSFVAPAAVDRALAAAVSDIRRGTGRVDGGTGTTVTGVALTLAESQPHWAVFNIGDSRVYRLAGDTLEQITVDHSVVQQLIDSGAITDAEAVTHPQANVITRAVGINDLPVPDYRVLPVVTGQRFLVCSDGLTRELTGVGLKLILSAGYPAQATAEGLVEAAVSNGGRDNVTAIVLDVVPPSTDRTHAVALEARRRH